MYRVALLCALLCAGAGARVLERCELARELSALGVRPDHLSTWVCIAYHESRFDTNANNPYSGDHGIFQISELYWCGAGKACGLPCAALHDDDISDDLDCALVVHEEHTRLQGNGFLAWVVYPQHCKHNTKKYLVDCDLNSKNSVLLTKSREYQYGNSYEQENDTVERQNVEKLLPPYLSIGNIVRENYGKVYDPNRGRTDWYNYKYDNIDDLRLPVFNQPSQYLSMPAPTSAPRRTTTTTTTTVAPRRTTTATTAYVPRVKVWRVIETNQFRKRKKFNEAEKATPKPEYSTDLGRYTQSTISSTSTQLPRTTVYPLSIATTPRVTTTTVRPTTRTTAATTPYTSRTSAFTSRLGSSTSTYTPRLPSSTTTYRPPVSTTTYKPWTSLSTFKPFTFTTTYKPSTTALTTRQWYTTTTRRPTTITTTTRKPTTTTRKLTTSTLAPRTVTTTYRPPSTTTVRPITTTTTRKPTTTWTWSSPTSKKPTVTTERAVTRKPKSDYSWYTFTSRTATTPSTTKLQTFSQTRTTQPLTYSTKTQNYAQSATTKAVTTTTSKPPTTTQKPRTTQSIFDLYLNPTKAPQLPSYKFSWGESKLKIFAGGTTTTPAPRSNGAKNSIK